jgi:hypothetical protein
MRSITPEKCSNMESIPIRSAGEQGEVRAQDSAEHPRHSRIQTTLDIYAQGNIMKHVRRKGRF